MISTFSWSHGLDPDNFMIYSLKFHDPVSSGVIFFWSTFLVTPTYKPRRASRQLTDFVPQVFWIKMYAVSVVILSENTLIEGQI